MPKRTKKSYKRSIFFLMVLLVCFILPQAVSAHASLVQANPGQGSHLDLPPKEVTLKFNERLGNDLYHLDVYNNDRKKATDQKATLSKKHKKLSVKLPALDDGVYTVSYKVISADGHPVSNTYTFSVGDVDSSAAASGSAHQGSDHHSISTFLVRIAYYLSLLLLTGWTIWGMFSKRTFDEEKTYQAGHKWLKLSYLLFLLGFGVVEFSSLLTGLGSDKIIPLFTSSAVGLSWLISFILALIAFPLLDKWKWFDGVWVIVLLGAEALNGHAFAYHPVALTLSFDLIHLLTAAIWSGGLLYLLYFWRKQHSDHVKRFLPVFSKAALVSIIILIITGTVNTFVFLPDIRDILDTLWGKLLILKTLLVIAVIVTASFIRRKMKSGTDGLQSRIKVDFSLMVAIFVIVGIFTYLNPVPTNEPLVWQADKNQVAMTTKITPKTPSSANTVTVKVDISKKPHQVKFFLHYQGNKDIAPIEVPLKLAKGEESGFIYKAKNVSIPFSGQWQVECRVLDANDDVTKFKKDMMIYSTS